MAAMTDAEVRAWLDQVWERARAGVHNANREVIDRVDVSGADLKVTRRTLAALGAVDLSDLLVSPGFRRDGFISSANVGTPEFRRWEIAHSLVKSCRSVAAVLGEFV